jgi:hypothetical protein
MMGIIDGIRKAELHREVDRKQWPSTVTTVVSYETAGVGTFATEPVMFGTPYSDAPFFTFGVELHSASTLQVNDYPFVSAGVGEWVTQEPPEHAVEKDLKLIHTGAIVWLNVSSQYGYRLIFRLTFEGTAMKNPQYLGGSNG